MALTEEEKKDRKWQNSLHSLPLFYNDRTAGRTWRAHKQSFEIWLLNANAENTASEQKQKLALCSSLHGAASRAMYLHGPTSASFRDTTTLEAYMQIIKGVFQPQAESQLARMDFEARKQAINEPISDYINDKIALFHSAEPAAGQHNFPYLRSHILKGIYCSWVKAEVIRIDPKDEQAISNAAARAVGQAREAYELGAGIVPNLDGLASTTVISGYLQAPTMDLGEPMEIGAIGNYKSESRTCYKCKKKGHIAANCRSSSGKQRDKQWQ